MVICNKPETTGVFPHWIMKKPATRFNRYAGKYGKNKTLERFSVEIMARNADDAERQLASFLSAIGSERERTVFTPIKDEPKPTAEFSDTTAIINPSFMESLKAVFE